MRFDTCALFTALLWLEAGYRQRGVMRKKRQTQKHSVWICPSGAQQETLEAEIAALARVTNTPVFAPHMTLLGDIGGDPVTTADICRRLFHKRSGIRTQVQALSSTERFFMSLILDLDVPDWLGRARHELASALGIKAVPEFRPHISLAYGYDGTTHAAIDRAALACTYQGKSMSLPRVVIAASASDIAIEAWQVLDSFTLQKPSG